ncbi:MAG: hypothetical protein M4579_005969 [Chaenotheca gracillima]|nr:MAG: hypothetical protein M4579_005969 [Chaenotheca gracillima]
MISKTPRYILAPSARSIQSLRNLMGGPSSRTNLPTFTSPRQQSFHSSRTTNLPRKDSQDKDSINTEATEYSKSGTDDQSAQQQEAAFDPKMTDPQEMKAKAGEGEGDGPNPLDVSPANPDVSKPRKSTEGGAETSANSGSRRSSGGGSPKKASPGAGS